MGPTHVNVSTICCSVCAQSCQACVAAVLVLLSMFSPYFLFLSVWMSGLSLLPEAHWSYTVSQQSSFHIRSMNSPEEFPPPPPLPICACQSHLQQLLKLKFLTTSIKDVAALLSHDCISPAKNFWISHYRKLEPLPSCGSCVCLFAGGCASCQFCVVSRYGS